ncbi:MAG TPA: RHS repeat-associated core domain-containing protein [Polyangia bacterium]|nr:RHS repeat-associated core domain-containing protein [Polyangia bacterium]
MTPTWLAQRQSGALGTAEQAAAQKALVHDGTSTLAYFDALGRQFLTIAHNRWLLDGVTTDDRPRTRLDLDIDGQQRREIDALDRVVMRLDGALLKAKSHQASMESGERWLLDDVTGKVIYLWDSLQRIFRTEYDPLRRPLAVRVTGADTLDPTRVILQRRTEYGEGAPNDSMLNLRGRVSRAYDEAGVVTHAEYDFKGNLLRGQRQLTSEYRALIDWSAPVALADIFTSSTRYDALNRAIEKTTPDGTVSHLTYDRGGHLQQVEADLQGTTPTVFVETIEYDAKGRRRRIEYGNGAITSYEYDPRTFRLTHLQTTRGAPFNDDCQDLHYTFDPAGNITAIRDDAQQTIYFRNRRVEPSAEYTYDATYRLIEAMGREHLGQLAGGALQPPTATSPDDAPRVGLPHPGDGNAVGLYVQRYAYDRAGNIVTMIHRGSDPLNPGWTRTYSYSEPSQLEPGKVNNRLTSTQVGSDPALPYSHDIHGNMIAMPHLSAMSWDCHDRLQSTARQAAGAPATTYYVYDSGGQRVRKATDAATRSERIYLGGFETYREYATDGITVTLERQTLHVMDDHHRIAIVETRTQGTDPSPAQLIRHQFGNHLDSAALELDPTGAVISYEEYYPYGSSSYQALNTETPKRYRYTSKERDDETGFNYHGARYYAPWLARWTSADPQLLGDGPNLFVYCRNNPIVGVDPNGYQTVVVPGAQSGAPVPPPAGGAIPPTPPRPPTPPAPPAPAETVPDSSGNYGLTTFQGGSANLRLHWTGEFDYIHFGSTSSRAESHNYYLGVRYGFSDHFTGGLALTPSTSRDPTGVSSSTTVVSAVGDISGVENDPAGHPLLRYHLFPSIGLTTLAGGGVAPTGGVIGGVESAGDNNHMVGGNVSVAAAPEGSAVAPGTPPLVTPVTVGATVATQHQLGPFTISAEVFAAIVIAGVRGSIRGAEELRVGWDVAVGLARPGTRGPNRQPAGGIQVMVGAVHSVDYFGTAPLPADQVFIGIGGSLTGP